MVCQLTIGTYTITNAQFVGSQIAASSTSRSTSKPQASVFEPGNSNNPLNNWLLRSLTNSQYTLQNPSTGQYLSVDNANSVRLDQIEYAWEIRPLPGSLYLIRVPNADGYALSLQSPNNGENLILLPATGAVTQNWIFNKV